MFSCSIFLVNFTSAKWLHLVSFGSHYFCSRIWHHKFTIGKWVLLPSSTTVVYLVSNVYTCDCWPRTGCHYRKLCFSSGFRWSSKIEAEQTLYTCIFFLTLTYRDSLLVTTVAALFCWTRLIPAYANLPASVRGLVHTGPCCRISAPASCTNLYGEREKKKDKL